MRLARVVLWSGEEVLAHVIEYVGQEWLSGVGRVPDPHKPLWYFRTVPPDTTRPGLRVVYDWFADLLKGSPYEAFACEVRHRWRQRVAEQQWPQFTATGGGIGTSSSIRRNRPDLLSQMRR